MRSRSNYDRYLSLGGMREGVVAGISRTCFHFHLEGWSRKEITVEQKRQGSHWVVSSTIDTVFLSRCAMLSSTSLTHGCWETGENRCSTSHNCVCLVPSAPSHHVDQLLAMFSVLEILLKHFHSPLQVRNAIPTHMWCDDDIF